MSEQQNQITNPAATLRPSIWWGVLVFIIVVLFGFSFWNQYLRDTTSQYVPADAAIYAKINLPRLANSPGLIKAVDGWIDDLDLPITNADIKREIAIVGQQQADGVSWFAIIKTDRVDEISKSLGDQRPHQKLSGQHIAISLDGQPVPTLATGDRSSVRGNFTLMIDGNRLATSSLDQFGFDFASNTDRSIELIGKVLPDGSFHILPAGKKDSLDTAIDQRNIVFSFTNIDQWQKDFWSRQRNANSAIFDQLKLGNELWRYQYGISLLDEKLLAGVSATQLQASPNGKTTAWPVADYDWQIVLERSTGWDQAAQASVENAISRIVGRQFPQQIVRLLTDDTNVWRLAPVTKKWAFADVDGQRELNITDYTTIRLAKSDNKLIITNNTSDWPAVGGDKSYLAMPTAVLPDEGMWRLLKGFEYILVSEDGVVVR